MDSSGVTPTPPTGPPADLSMSGGVAPPVVVARFLAHLQNHGLAYAVGWLVLDATGTWSMVAGQVSGMC